MNKIYVELSEKVRENKSIIRDKENNIKIYSDNFFNKRITALFSFLFILLISIIGLIIFKVKKSNYKSGENNQQRLEEINTVLTEEVLQLKGELEEAHKNLEDKISKLEKNYQEMNQMKEEMSKLKDEIKETKKISNVKNLEENKTINELTGIKNKLIELRDNVEIKEMKDLQNDINNLLKKLEEKEIQQLKEKEKENQKEIENLKDLIQKSEDSNSNEMTLEKQKELEIIKKVGSNIIGKIEDLKFLENRLLKEHEGKKVKYDLLFRASRDGDRASIFHKLCDNIKGTLVLIKTKKNLRFGGYTEKLWNSLNEYVPDLKAFCFSFDIKKIYNIIGIENAIYSSNEYGPIFGNTVFAVEDNFFIKGGWSTTSTAYDHPLSEINNSEEDFIIEELEVFQIIFE